MLVAPFRPAEEHGLLLHNVCGGEAAEELETMGLADLMAEDGVDRLLRWLQPSFAEPRVHRVGALLTKWEEISREPTEPIFEFVKRFDRVDRELRNDGYNIDNEQRGFKLLKRARLSGDQLRLILSNTQNSYLYDDIKGALKILYPHVEQKKP